MKAYYQDLITQQSWLLLQKLQKQINFILVGGWAVFSHTNGLKSKDIDIMIDYQELSKIKERFVVNKNQRLLKYEIKQEGIDVDIYLPHYSNLGIPVEELIKYHETIAGYRVLKKEALLISKQTAYQARRVSVKGQKDLIDIFSLIMLADFDFVLCWNLLKQFGLEKHWQELNNLLKNTKSIMELGLTVHSFKKQKDLILNKLQKVKKS